MPTHLSEAETVSVRDFGAAAQAGTDDSPAFAAALAEAIRRGPGATLLIPAGTYPLQTPMDGGMIAIRNAAGLTVRGEAGTTLLSNQPTQNMLHVVDSRDVAVRNLTMDRHPFVFTQGRIVALDVSALTVDVVIDPGYDEPDAPYLARLRGFLVWTDPQSPTYDHSRHPPAVLARDQIAPGLWRLRLSDPPLPGYLGKRFLLWDNVYKGWGVVATRSRDVLVEDVRYYGGGADAGMAVWNCPGDVTFRRFVVGVPPGSDRLIAAAGGSQEFNNRGTVTLEECDVSRVDDDGVNMGTTFCRVLAQPAPRVLLVEASGAAFDAVPFQAGDRLALWDWFEKAGRTEATLLAVEAEEEGVVRLTLDADVEALHPAGSPGLPRREDWDGQGRFEQNDGVDRVASFQAAGRLVLRDCLFQTLRARNVLLKTSGSLIEGCTFYDTHMCSILVGPEFYWGEAPGVRDLVIRGNRFVNVDGSSIEIGSHPSEASRDNTSILIEGNTFEGYGARGGVGITGQRGTAIRVRNADGVTIRGNTFRPSPDAPAGAPPVIVKASRNVLLTGNDGVPDAMIVEAA